MNPRPQTANRTHIIFLGGSILRDSLLPTGAAFRVSVEVWRIFNRYIGSFVKYILSFLPLPFCVVISLCYAALVLVPYSGSLRRSRGSWNLLALTTSVLLSSPSAGFELYMPVGLVNVTRYERNEVVKKILRGVFKYLKTKMSSKGYREKQPL